MRPLIITNETRGKIAQMVRYAEDHRIGFAELKARSTAKPGRYEPIGNDPHRTLDIDIGYRATFSVEEQPKPLGWVRHLSVSIDLRDTGRPLPSLAAVQLLMLEFGMRQLDQKRDMVYIENLTGGECDGKQAVCVVQRR